MKNLFKNLMLVAVAAMAFTACEKDIVNGGEEQNAEARSFKFYATFADDTRSGFVAKEDGATAYKSEWSGNETIGVTHTSYCYDDGFNLVDNTTSGDRASFEVEFYGQNPNPGAEIVAVSPASAWKAKGLYNAGGYAPIAWEHTYTIPTTQTPTANSVDEAAHILKAVTTYNGNDNIALTFEHQVAYGKFSLKNFAGTGVTSYTLNIDGTKYVINSENTTDVWFACESAVVANMTISVKAAEGTYSKTLVKDSDKTLEFINGQVSKFAVDMTDATAGEAEVVFNPDVLYDTLVWDSSNSRFKLTGTGVSEWRIYLNSANRPNNNSISADTYTGCGGKNPSAGMFGAEIRNLGLYTSAFGSSSTLEVNVAGGEYVILLTHSGTTYGYKGLPSGWPAPVASEPEPEPEPEPEQPSIDLTGFTKCNLVSFTAGSAFGTSYDFISTIYLQDSAYGDTLIFDLAEMNGGISVSNKTIKEGIYTFVTDWNNFSMEASNFKYCGMNYSTQTSGTVEVYNTNGTYTIKVNFAVGAYSMKYYYQGTL